MSNGRSRFVVTTAASFAFAFFAVSASAVYFELDGTVTNCDPFACALVGLSVGDPVDGFIEVDDEVGAPGSFFTEIDIYSARYAIGAIDSDIRFGAFGTASFGTDLAGEIATGAAAFTITVDTGFGLADVDFSFDANTGLWTATTAFNGIGAVADGVFSFSRCVFSVFDTDADCVADAVDNCMLHANPTQRDSNGDLFGNRCDPDLNDDGIVNSTDLGLLGAVYLTDDDDADFNGDGIVNPIDLGLMNVFYLLPPGPSGLILRPARRDDPVNEKK